MMNTKQKHLIVSILFIAGLTILLGFAWVSETPAAGPASFSKLAEKASPSVVNISAVKVIERQGSISPFGSGDQFEEFFERFFGDQFPRQFKQQSLGSGFVIDEEGLILTNNHVVEKTEEIQVTLNDQSEFTAEIVGRDSKTDLALIKIDADRPLEPLPLGDSSELKVGAWVLAIGSPFGLGNTVTAGIVSAKYRELGMSVYEDVIQTDASINRGSSGGPLLNEKGEVVGINTAILSQSGGNVGIGFAIPVNMAKDLLPQLKEGKVIRGWLGVMVQAVTPELQKAMDLDKAEGALVSQVTGDGPAEKAGLKRGDVIVEYDGKAIKEMGDLPYLVAKTPVGKEVEVEVIRNGNKKRIDVEIGKLKEETEETGKKKDAEEGEPQLGMAVQEITPRLARQYNLPVAQGIVIVRVQSGSPAAAAGLRSNDIIMEVDQEPVPDMESFTEKMKQYEEGDTILFLINRDGSTIYVTVEVE